MTLQLSGMQTLEKFSRCARATVERSTLLTSHTRAALQSQVGFFVNTLYIVASMEMPPEFNFATEGLFYEWPACHVLKV